uniref:RRM domain-containing protein n=1 Tax=Phytophthora ramorum TaxID=164328 RepID=H3G7Q1_PHYRM
DGPQPGKLFIGGVSWETTEDTLRQHFGKYGELTDAALMKDKYTGQPRGFGFVTFADASAIDRVLDETHTLDGRSVEVKRAIPRERTAPGSRLKKIFVGGLAPTVTEQDFRHYFEEYGKITDAVVMIDRDTQRSRGFGFITFEDE